MVRTRPAKKAGKVSPKSRVGDATQQDEESATTSTVKSASDYEDMDIPGVDELSEPPNDLNAYKVLIYGDKSVGKTSICTSAPGAYTLQFDPDRRNIRARQTLIPSSSIASISGGGDNPFEMALVLIAKAADDPSVDILHIDNFQRYYEAALNSFCGLNGIEDPKNLSESWGEGWRKLKAYYQEPLMLWSRTGKGLILTAHSKTHLIKTIEGTDPLTMIGPAIADAPFEFIKEVCDFAFCMERDSDNKRMLWLRSAGSLWACCGSKEHFVNPRGEAIERIYLGEDGPSSWKTLEDSFNNKVWGVDDEPDDAPKPKAKTFLKPKAKSK
jgi:hypothetical protein